MNTDASAKQAMSLLVSASIDSEVRITLASTMEAIEHFCALKSAGVDVTRDLNTVWVRRPDYDRLVAR